MEDRKTISEHIQYFLNEMGADDFRIISEILEWSDDKKLAFVLAKNIFDE